MIKKFALIIIIAASLISSDVQASDSTSYFEEAFIELRSMLEGQAIIDIERAVYLSEAPYWNKQYTYETFQLLVSKHAANIGRLISSNDSSGSMDFAVKVGSNGRFDMNKLLYTENEKKLLYQSNIKNWAIFTYLTDTVILHGIPRLPFKYSSNDPFGKSQWRYSQVINLIGTSEGRANCYSLAMLYKLLADRLEAGAKICTAPQHIYIQHRDKAGDMYNVELATAGHPSDGEIQTLTNTPSQAIKSGIALREYNNHQLIGLLLVNLAKSYERKFMEPGAEFLLRCAELALKYDENNLNALLLKQQVLDHNVYQYIVEQGLDLNQIRSNAALSLMFEKLEDNTKTLYGKGYRPMPIEMQQAVLDGFRNSQEAYLFYLQDKNPSPFTTIQPLKEEDASYHSLSGGLFTEVWQDNDYEVFGHFIYETKTGNLVGYENERFQRMIIDPVAFAYDLGARHYDASLGRFISQDPLKAQFPSWSPYVGLADNPIYYTDPDGKAVKAANQDALKLIYSVFEMFNTTIDGEAATGAELFGFGNKDPNGALFKTTGTMEAFQGLLDRSGLSKEQKSQAQALFSVMRTEDVIEVGLVNQNSNLQEVVSQNRSGQNSTRTQTDNPDSDNLINNRGTMSNPDIRSELLSQKNSGKLDGNGAFGFFYNNSNTAKVGGTVGILLINSNVVNGSGDGTGSFGQPSNVNAGFGASERAVLNGIVDFSKTKAFKKTIN